MELLKPYTYMSLKGCLIDQNRLREHRNRLIKDIMSTQEKIYTTLGKHINVKSHLDKKWLLYEHLGFPKIYKGRGSDKKLTSDEEAILNCKFKAKDPNTVELLADVLTLIKARTDFSDSYKLEPFKDNRIRCSYNPVGTDTGRLSSSETSVRGMRNKGKVVMKKLKSGTTFDIQIKPEFGFFGTNLQNVSKWLRDVFIPDPGYVFWQYDYSGADAWTVAADTKALGNPHMLEHLSLGIKPSCVILMMQRWGTEVMRWNTDKILEAQPEMKNMGKMYVCSKACQHGSNYGMGASLLADTIFKRSNGDIRIEPSVAADLQRVYEQYYQVSLRTQWIERELKSKGQLSSASGSVRKFLALRSRSTIDPSVLRSALSFEPQNNTTYATNLALHHLYYDPENRRGNSLRIQPLLMIHDALAGQVHVNDLEWAKEYLPVKFKATLNIHNQPITIPAEGGFGDNWKEID
jgi:hypothetical protein